MTGVRTRVLQCYSPARETRYHEDSPFYVEEREHVVGI